MARKRKLYNGKPFSYWESVARDIVVAALVRAGSMYERRLGSVECLPHDLAAKQLMNLAKGISESLFDKIVRERDRCKTGMALIVTDMLPSSRRPATRKKKV